MSEALTIRERLFQSVTTVEVAPTLEQVAAELGISPVELAEALNHKDVAQIIQAKTKARAMLAMDACMNRLVKMANSDDDKTAQAAISLITRLSGAMKPQPINIRFNFEELIKQAAQASAGPLSNITQIREAEVIDAEQEDNEE